MIHGESMKGPGPALRALRTKTLTRVKLQHLPQIPASFIAYVSLTQKASEFLVGPTALHHDPVRELHGLWEGSREALQSLPCPSYYNHPSARCISKAWVCDGNRDCEDNSDEKNCESLACRPPSHPCANNPSVCLPPDKLCDGNDDCGDGSDEGELCGEAQA